MYKGKVLKDEQSSNKIVREQALGPLNSQTFFSKKLEKRKKQKGGSLKKAAFLFLMLFYFSLFSLFLIP